jgi:Acetyltransferase (GNAT) domain
MSVLRTGAHKEEEALIVVERKFLGLAKYRVFFYPTAEIIHEIANGLGKLEMARLFLTPVPSASGPCLVRHHLTGTSLIDLTRGPGAIWAGFESNCRNQIRKAEKLASRVKLVRNGAQAEQDFLAVFNEFARRGGAVSPLNSATMDRYRNVSDVFIIYLDDKPMAVNLVLRDEQAGRVRGTYLASSRFAGSEEAKLTGWLTRYMMWLQMQHYIDQRFSTYDLGGMKPGVRSGATEFKRGFGGTIVMEHSYLCAGTRWLGALVCGAYEMLSPSAGHMMPAGTHQTDRIVEQDPPLSSPREHQPLSPGAESEPT